MKSIIYTFLILSVFSIFSCKKDSTQLSIKQYDSTQIQQYIAAHGLTGFSRDLAGGDTSGIYYKIIKPGDSTQVLTYPTQIAMVYTLKTFDGSYTSTDVIANHFYNYLGHVASSGLPLGLQTAIINDLKFNGGIMEVLIPSRLAYGRAGSGSGSSQVANNRIAGNECLDYYVQLVSDFATFDDQVIQKYMVDSNLMGYTKVQAISDTINSPKDSKDYYYYKVLTPGTGSDAITDNSTVTVTYTGQTYNAVIFDQYNTSGGTPLFVGGLTEGVKEALERPDVLLNAKVSILVPSRLAYGVVAQSGIPAFSCLRFTFIVDAVTP